MDNRLHIVTVNDIAKSRSDGKGAAIAIAILLALITFAITGIMALFGNGTFITVLGWTVGMFIFFWFIGHMTFRKDGKSDRENAEKRIREAVAGLADPDFAPSENDYEKLIVGGETMEFTIGGITGPRIVKLAGTSTDTDHANRKISKDSYVFHADHLDDGTENFERMLAHAIETNEDIRRAAGNTF